jgi:hypothetical protein
VTDAIDGTDIEELQELERAGWEALSTEGAAAPWYEEVLAGEVLFLLPGGMVIDDRNEVVRSVGGPPWSSYELSDLRVLPLGAGSALVAYRAKATRDGNDYEALFASTYVRDGEQWRLAVHQQTPI